MNTLKGKFITFEGGEGVGKTTQIKILSVNLQKMGYKIHTTREPGGTEIAEKIRNILKTSSFDIDPICETLLMFSARREHYVKVIKPLLQEGYIVISDRFYDSSLVYQGILKSVSFNDIMLLKQMTIGELEPDITIVLDFDAKSAYKRVVARNLIPNIISDQYDGMDQKKYEQVREGFQKIADIFSFRVTLISAHGAEKKISEKILKVIEEIL